MSTRESWCGSRVRPTAAPGRSAPAIPIYLAAVNEGMARIAGAVADGVVSHPMATVRYIDEVMRPAIAQGAEREGRSRPDVAIADWLLVAVSDDAEQAREDAKRQIAFHATVRTYDRILDLHGFDGHRGADPGALAELRPRRDDRARDRRDAR